LRKLRPKFWFNTLLFTVMLFLLRLWDAMWANPWSYKILRSFSKQLWALSTDIHQVFIFLDPSAPHCYDLFHLHMSRILVCQHLGISHLQYGYVNSSIYFFTIPENSKPTSTLWLKTQVTTFLQVLINFPFRFWSL